MWPCIPLVVPQATLGTAMGLATSIQMVGIGNSNPVVDRDREPSAGDSNGKHSCLMHTEI